MTLVAQYTVYVWIEEGTKEETDEEADTRVNKNLEEIDEYLHHTPNLKEFEFEELHVW